MAYRKDKKKYNDKSRYVTPKEYNSNGGESRYVSVDEYNRQSSAQQRQPRTLIKGNVIDRLLGIDDESLARKKARQEAWRQRNQAQEQMKTALDNYTFAKKQGPGIERDLRRNFGIQQPRKGMSAEELVKSPLYRSVKSEEKTGKPLAPYADSKTQQQNYVMQQVMNKYKKDMAELGYGGIKQQRQATGKTPGLLESPLTVSEYNENKAKERAKIKTGAFDMGNNASLVSDEGLRSFHERQVEKADKSFNKAVKIQKDFERKMPGTVWGDEVFDWLEQLDESKKNSRPAGYYTGDEEEYNRNLYNAVHGEGSYERRVDALENDDEADALDRELDDLWAKWERGEIKEYQPDEDDISDRQMLRNTAAERRQDSLDIANNFFQFDYDPETWQAGWTPEEQREGLYNRLMEDRDTYEDRVSGMTPEEKNEFDRRLDAVLATANGSADDMWDFHAYDYSTELKKGDAYTASAEQAEKEIATRDELSRFDREADYITGQGYTGEYNPLMHPEAGSVLGNPDPQGTELEKAYYWINNPPEKTGYGDYLDQVNKYFFLSRDPDNDQVKQFNQFYEYDKQKGTHLAEAYLEALDPYLQSCMKEYQEIYAKSIAENPVRGIPARILSYPGKLATGLIGTAGTVAALAGVESAQDSTSDWYKGDVFFQNVREQQNENIDKSLGGNGTGKFLMGVIDSIADNLMAMGTGTALSAGNLERSTKLVQAIMSFGATSSKMTEMLDEGYEPREAALYAIGDGIIEAVTEKYSIEELLQPNVREMLGNKKQLAKFIAKNIVTEGSEEMASDMLNIGMDWLLSNIFDHDTEIQQKYKELVAQGTDPNEASRMVLEDTIEQIGMSGLAGALSGGFMAGGRVAINAVSQSRTGSNVIANKNMQRLLDVGLGMKEGTDSRAYAEELSNSKKKPSNVQLGKLAQLMVMETGEEQGNVIKSTIEDNVQTELQQAGVKNAAEAAEVISRNLIEGTKLSRTDMSVLAEDQASIDLWKEYITDSDKINQLQEQIEQKTQGQRSIIDQVGELTGEKAKSTSALAAEVERSISETKTAEEAIDNLQARQPVYMSEKYASAAKELLETDSSAKKNTNYLDDVVKIRMAAMTLAKSLPQTRLSTEAAQQLFDMAREEFNEADANRVVNQAKVIPGQGQASFEGAAYGTAEWQDKVKGLSKQQRNQVGALAEIVTRMGNRLNLINDTANPGIYGFEQSDGTITINVAGMNRSGLGHHMLVTMSHELTHWLEQNSSEGYNALRQYVVDSLRSKGENVEQMIVRTIDNQNMVLGEEEGRLDLHGAMAEIVAKSCENLLSSESFRKEIAKTNPSLYNKIKGFVKDFVARMREAVKGMSGSLSKEAVTLMDRTEEIAKLWLGAREEALGRETNTGRSQTEGTISYSLVDKNGNVYKMTKDQIEQNKKTVSTMPQVATINENRFAKTEQEDFKTRAIEYVDSINNKAINNILGDITLDIKGIEHLIVNLTSRRAALLPAVKDVLENGKIINIADKGEHHNFDSAIIAAPVIYENDTYYMGVVVKQVKEGNSYYMHDAILAKVKDGSLPVIKSLFYQAPRSNPSSIANILRTIPEYNVKTGKKSFSVEQLNTKEFKDWFSNSKVVNEDGSPMIVYHGTSEDFTAFDMSKGRANMDIQGAFFSPWEIEAGGYGEKVGAYYLSIQNPAPEGIAYKALNMFKGQNNAGIKAREYLIKQGYDGVQNYDEFIAFYPTQIKSATDNIGTFDKTNPDYRFSVEQTPDMDVSAWMESLTPGSLQTEHERQLLGAYKDLRMKRRVTQQKISDYEKQIKKMEGQENLTAGDRDTLLGLKNKLKVNEAKLERLDDQLYEVTSSEGYAGMMYKMRSVMSDFIEGKTQAQVMAAVDSMSNEAERVAKEIEKQEKDIRRLSENSAVRIVRSELSRRGLTQTVNALKSEYNTSMTENELRGRMAEIVLKMVNGEDAQADIDALANEIINNQMGFGNEDAEDTLRDMRGMTIEIGPGQQAELKATHGSLNSIRSRTKGSGIRFVYGESSTLDKNYDELQRKFPALNGLLDNEKDSLENFVSYVEGLLAQRKGNAADLGISEDEAALFIRSMAEVMLNEELGGLNKNELLKKIRDKASAIDKAMGIVQGVKKTTENLQVAARKAAGWNSFLHRDIAAALDYYNKVARQAAQVERQKVRESIIETLKSEHTRDMMQQQAKYEEMIRKDKDARELYTSNEKERRKINTVAARFKRLLTEETDKKNIQEEAKPLARMVSRMLVDHDAAGWRRVLFATQKELADYKWKLDKMDAGAGAFDMDTDLDWLVIRAQNEEDNDYSIRDKVMVDLMNIESGLLEYRQAEGQGVISLQDRNRALTKVQEAVSEIYDVIKARGEAFIQGQKWQVYELAEMMREDMGKSRFRGERTGKLGMAEDTMEKIVGYGNLTPEYFIKNLKNRAMTLLNNGAHEAENQSGIQAYRAQQRIDQIVQETGYGSWDNNEIHHVAVRGGETVDMTTEQLMALYATWMREKNQLRPEETAHLLKGGFVLAQGDRSKGIYGREKTTQHPVRITAEQLDALANELTPEQVRYVEAIVDYMSNDLAELGNEASMRMFGIKKFTEKFYFPIKSWGGVLNESSASGVNNMNDNRAARQSFTKRVTANASNAIEIGDFTATAMNHIAGMIRFNTIAPAVENMNRVLNQQLEYGERTEEEDNTYKRNMRAAFQEAYGENAYKYLKQYMTDLNGGVAAQQDNSLKERLLSLFRKGAVAGSMSVAMQQPLSYIRAAILINPKYLAQAILPQHWGKIHEEMMRYSGVAVIKEMGRFDMNQGRSMIDYISPEQQKSRAKKTAEWISEKSTILPEKMDAITWGRMWIACKLETAEKNPGMDQQSDEFLTRTAERFNEVMRLTQVYDSPLVRSQNMRSKNYAVKSVTSFMAEPTLTLNVLADAVMNAKEQGGMDKVAKTAAAHIMTAVLAALFKAVWSTGRSPDKDKTWTEQFLTKWASNFFSEANPLNLIAGYGDIVEAIKKGELADDAMSVLGKLKSTMKTAGSMIKNGVDYRGIEDTVGQVIQVFTRVPLKNIMRDARAMYNFMAPGTYASRQNSAGVIKYGILDAYMNADSLTGTVNSYMQMMNLGYGTSNKAYYQRLYEAMKDRNAQRQADLKEYLTLGKGVKEDTITSNLRTLTKDDRSLTPEQKIDSLRAQGMKDSDIASWITTEYKEGKLTRAQAEALYVKANPEKKADDAYLHFEQADWEKETGNDLSGDTAYFRLDEALDIDDRNDYEAAVKELQEHGYKLDKIQDHAADRIMKKYKKGDSDRQTTLNGLKKYAGMKDEDAWWKIDRVDYQKETGAEESYSGNYYRLTDAVNANSVEKIRRAVELLLKHGITKEKIKDKLSYWKSAYTDADSNGKIRIRNAITVAYKALGFTAEDAEKTIARWIKEKAKK